MTLHDLPCSDDTFGHVREAIGLRPCEDGRHPVSRYTINAQSIQFLKDFSNAAQSPIFRHAALEMVFIWAIDEECRLKLAIEEFAVEGNSGLGVHGIPRPRTLGATKGFMKLGHPTLIDGDEKLARIAGELYLRRADDDVKKLVWGINAESGRFCDNSKVTISNGAIARSPTKAQLGNVAALFENYGLNIFEVDYLRCV